MDPFVALAEIAGVFVGFGALISVFHRDEIDAIALGRVRTVVMIGLVTMVGALVPVLLGRYGIPDQRLWSLSSLIFFVLCWISIIVPLRKQDVRELLISQLKANPALAAIFWLGLEVPIQLPLILAVLGVYPDLGPAFYTTAVVINLFQAALVLAQLVFAQVVPSRGEGHREPR